MSDIATLARWQILDEVILPDMPEVKGRPQRGFIEKLDADRRTGLMSVRLQGGPDGGTLKVVDAERLRRPETTPFRDY
ncbi:hypothetical protein sos41_11480 [Alphaproteobacteria bacterium SO-S41]|nr:hypothetical protein sos41_11480 [Alphaproteobacteria bacterium SO-S41]